MLGLGVLANTNSSVLNPALQGNLTGYVRKASNPGEAKEINIASCYRDRAKHWRDCGGQNL